MFYSIKIKYKILLTIFLGIVICVTPVFSMDLAHRDYARNNQETDQETDSVEIYVKKFLDPSIVSMLLCEKDLLSDDDNAQKKVIIAELKQHKMTDPMIFKKIIDRMQRYDTVSKLRIIEHVHTKDLADLQADNMEVSPDGSLLAVFKCVAPDKNSEKKGELNISIINSRSGEIVGKYSVTDMSNSPSLIRVAFSLDNSRVVIGFNRLSEDPLELIIFDTSAINKIYLAKVSASLSMIDLGEVSFLGLVGKAEKIICGYQKGLALLDRKSELEEGVQNAELRFINIHDTNQAVEGMACSNAWYIKSSNSVIVLSESEHKKKITQFFIESNEVKDLLSANKQLKHDIKSICVSDEGDYIAALLKPLGYADQVYIWDNKGNLLVKHEVSNSSHVYCSPVQESNCKQSFFLVTDAGLVKYSLQCNIASDGTKEWSLGKNEIIIQDFLVGHQLSHDQKSISLYTQNGIYLVDLFNHKSNYYIAPDTYDVNSRYYIYTNGYALKINKLKTVSLYRYHQLEYEQCKTFEQFMALLFVNHSIQSLQAIQSLQDIKTTDELRYKSNYLKDGLDNFYFKKIAYVLTKKEMGSPVVLDHANPEYREKVFNDFTYKEPLDRQSIDAIENDALLSTSFDSKIMNSVFKTYHRIERNLHEIGSDNNYPKLALMAEVLMPHIAGSIRSTGYIECKNNLLPEPISPMLPLYKRGKIIQD